MGTNLLTSYKNFPLKICFNGAINNFNNRDDEVKNRLIEFMEKNNITLPDYIKPCLRLAVAEEEDAIPSSSQKINEKITQKP